MGKSSKKQEVILNVELESALRGAGVISDISSGILDEKTTERLLLEHKRIKDADGCYSFSKSFGNGLSFHISAANDVVHSIRRGGDRPYKDPKNIPASYLDSFYGKWFDRECDWELYFSFLSLLRDFGFIVFPYKEARKRYRTLKKSHHQGAFKRLRFRSEIYPTDIKFEFYQDRVGDNCNGPYYARNKFSLMDYETRSIVKLVMDKMAHFAKDRGLKDRGEPVLRGPYEKLFWRKLNCWHWDKTPLHLPQGTEKCNDTDLDGVRLKNGDLRYFKDYDGRVRRGLVFHNLNNMWWVVSSGELRNIASHHLFTPALNKTHIKGGRSIPPSETKRKIESELKKAIEEERFEQATVLRDLRNRLFDK